MKLVRKKEALVWVKLKLFTTADFMDVLDMRYFDQRKILIIQLALVQMQLCNLYNWCFFAVLNE